MNRVMCEAQSQLDVSSIPQSILTVLWTYVEKIESLAQFISVLLYHPCVGNGVPKGAVAVSPQLGFPNEPLNFLEDTSSVRIVSMYTVSQKSVRLTPTND